MTKTQQHHIMGPSTLPRATACAASTQLAAEAELLLPETSENESATLGTAKHALIAEALKPLESGTKPIDLDVSGADIQVHRAVEFLRFLVEQQEHFGRQLKVVRVEQTLTLERSCQGLVPQNLLGVQGTPDLVLIFESDGGQKHAVVVDWKTGWRGPDRTTREQIKAYLAMVQSQLLDYQDTVEGRILHTATDEDAWEVPDPCYDEEIDVQGVLLKWSEVAARNLAPEARAETTAGSHCRWCPALGVCGATRYLVSELQALAGEGSQDFAAQFRERVLASDVEEQALRLIDSLPTLNGLVDRLKDLARAFEEREPGSTGCYSLVEQNGPASVSDPGGLWDALEDAGMEGEGLWSALSWSLPRLRKLWSARGREAADLEDLLDGRASQSKRVILKRTKK